MAAPPQRRPNSVIVAERQAACFGLRSTGLSIRAIRLGAGGSPLTEVTQEDVALAKLISKAQAAAAVAQEHIRARHP